MSSYLCALGDGCGVSCGDACGELLFGGMGGGIVALLEPD